MSFAISPLQHWSAEPSSVTFKSPEFANIISTAMGVSVPEYDQIVAAVRGRKATIQRELGLLAGIEAQRARLREQDALAPDFDQRVADFETAEAEAGQKLSSSETALKEAQTVLESAEKERDAVKAKFSDVCEKLRIAERGKRTKLNEKKRLLQIDTSKRFSACAALQEAVDRAQAKVQQDKARISRIRGERERLLELRRSQAPELLRLKERWNQARAKVEVLQQDLDRFIEIFISRNFADETPEDRQHARSFLQYC